MRNLFSRAVFPLALCSCLALVPACAGFLAAAPTVAEVTSDAVAVLGMVQSAVSAYYASHPADPSTQQKIATAIVKAQQALVVGERTLAGVASASEGQTAAAFADFAQAWGDLMQVVAPLGIVTSVPPASDAGSRVGAHLLTVVPVPFAARH